MNKVMKASAIALASFMLGATALEATSALGNGTVTVEAAKKKKKKLSKAAKKRKLVNKEIAKALEEDHGWANGTLDENGNPVENGTPNEDFSWSLSVEKIKYTKKGQLNVTVNGSFYALTDEAKTKVGNRAQNTAILVLGEHYKKYEDMTDVLFVSFYDGSGNAVGNSKLGNYRNFKFYK